MIFEFLIIFSGIYPINIKKFKLNINININLNIKNKIIIN